MGVSDPFESVDFDPFATAQIEQVISSTESQREVWLGDRLGRDASLAFNEAVQLTLRGELDAEALTKAMRQLVQRHDSLRSSFGPDGTEMLVGDGSDFAFTISDLSLLSEEERADLLGKAVEAEVLEPFDLQRGPLFRASVYKVGLETRILLAAHHIVCDGWSWGVLIGELAQLYRESHAGADLTLPAPFSFARYANWEVEQAASEEVRSQLNYWLSEFSGTSLPVLDLPVDRLRRGPRRFASLRYDHLIDRALLEKLRLRAASEGLSLYSWLFSGFVHLLHRLTGQDDLVVGVPVAGQAASGMRELVGHCVNLLPVRIGVDDGISQQAFAHHCSSKLLSAFENQAVTYGALLRHLPLQRDTARLPLVSVMFNLDQPMAGSKLNFGGLAADLQSVPRRFENFELFVNISQIDMGLRLECQYLSDLFDSETIARWMRCFETLLKSSVVTPELPLRAQVLIGDNDRQELDAIQTPSEPYPRDALMQASFELQVRRTPDRIALRFGDAVLSYFQLDQRANRLARAIRRIGVRRGVKVGLCIPREFDMVVGVLAVLKAGGAFVPLEPTLPTGRLEFYAQDSGMALLLTQSGASNAPRTWCERSGVAVFEIDHRFEWLSEDPSPLPVDADSASAEDHAYVVYTSGSTGRPKGICVPHRPVVNFLNGMLRTPGISADDRLAMVTTLSFDPAVLDIMLPLSVGAQIILVPQPVVLDAQALSDLLTRTGATIMQATPSLWRNLVMTTWRSSSDRRMEPFRGLIGGESLPSDLAVSLCERVDELWNLYGPTETTVWATAWRVDKAGLLEYGVSVGRPIANVRVWILDDHGQPCPIGVSGEICIAGECMSSGYLNRDDLTLQAFVPDPFGAPGAKLYRTGDRGRWRNDGLLEHQGRFDFQVKLRGYRIELGEIEATSNEFNQVRQTVVLAREDRPGDKRLVAYLQLHDGQAFDRAKWQVHLRQRLPDYMVPQHVVLLDCFPLLPNGKLDRKALPVPHDDSAADSERLAPRSDTERQLLAAMIEVLNLPGMGIKDDFFIYGGHSLLAARLTTRINREMDLNLPLRTLFETPTVEGLAVTVDSLRHKGGPQRVQIAAQPDRKRAPLTVMQERIRFLEELYPGRSVYNEPSAHRLRGPMDIKRFREALHIVARRQSVLRTSIVPDASGTYVQQIEEHVSVDMPLEDLSTVPHEQRESELMQRMQRVTDTPIPIDRAPMAHVRLYRLSEEEHVFLFVPHHLIWDGWSFDLLYEEMASAYSSLQRDLPPSLPLPSVSYGDFSDWHRQWMASEVFTEALAFWKERLLSAPSTRPIPSDKPRRPGMTGAGAAHWIRINSETTERLREVARHCGVTMSMLTMSVFSVLMRRLLEDDPVTIGVPVRGRVISEIDSVMGFFNNLVAVRIDGELDRSFADFAGGVRARVLEAFDHQDVPFESLVLDPDLAPRLRDEGLYHALFSFQDARQRTRRWGDLSHQSILIQQSGATEDLGMWLMEVPSGMEGAFIYNADLFEADTVARFRSEYEMMLRRLITDAGVTPRQLLNDFRYSTRTPAVATDSSNGVSGKAVLEGVTSNRANVSSSVDVPRLTPMQSQIRDIWAQLLNAPKIEAGDNFFDLGGSSMLAMQAVERIMQATDRRIPAGNLAFDTLAQIAATLEQTPITSTAKSDNIRRGPSAILQKIGLSLRRK